MARPSQPLVSNLLRVREALERMIARLQAGAAVSATDEQRLRRGRRVLRKINHEYLPWARSPALTTVKVAEITLHINLAWKQLSLAQFEG